MSYTDPLPERDSRDLPPMPDGCYPPDAVALPDERTSVNLDPPLVRCRMCGGRCRNEGDGWISCRCCSWSSFHHRRTGWLWRLRIWIGR